MDAHSFRLQFPALVAEPAVAYLDSASTTQKPQHVVDAVNRFLTGRTANPGRGGYPWASLLHVELEHVRARVAGFLGAQRPEQVVFTGGATDSLNLVARCWAQPTLRAGDAVLHSPLDHASNVLPWHDLQRTLHRHGTAVRVLPYRTGPDGAPDLDQVADLLRPEVRLLAMSHVHNLFGARAAVERLRGALGDTLLCLDASQSAGHLPLDVTTLGADFVAFSGHKMFGLPGTGVLYCGPRVADALAPARPGGGSGRLDGHGMLRDDPLPARLEGGSPDAVGILALGAALDVLERAGVAALAEHGRALTVQLAERLRTLPGVELLPGPHTTGLPEGYGIVSFRLRGTRSGDVGFALADRGVFVRAGQHCLAADSPHQDSVRVSVHGYTTDEDVDRLIGGVRDLLRGAA